MNIYAPNSRALTFIKETLLKLKIQISSYKIIMGDFNTPLTAMNRSWKNKLNRDHNKTNRSYEPNGFNISIEQFIQKQKNIPSSQHILIISPKVTI